MARGAKPIFVAATRQHVGKTTVSLALMAGLKKRFPRVGFLKPVGQQHVTVSDEKGSSLRVDKDVQVMKEHFALDHVAYDTMSPVLIPKGYTSRYIAGEHSRDEQVKAIRDAYEAQQAASDFVLVEGTGHVGVGSIVEMSNAHTAALIDADVVLVSNGGLGRAFDELEMNRRMFAAEGVAIRGVVLNKVTPDKVEMVRDKMSQVLRERWGVPLLGVVPDLPYLGKATLGDLEGVLEANLLAGHRCRGLHYGVHDAFLVTTGLRRFLRRAFEQREANWNRPLFVTHATRDDLLLGFLAHHQKKMKQQENEIHGADMWAGAIVLSIGASRNFPDLEFVADDHQPLSYLVKMAVDTDAPVLITNKGTVDALECIKSFTAKHNITDRVRITAAIEHYEPQIDFDLMLR
ncbi:hypothetical protein AB1Y20_011979 [Prymnesium parvum]|uniref:DRTGG domain-containing protein n=1 Tax=Prymnesium parvum TaxID=97485 RepID=A0AB34IQT6_PRYPA